MNMQQIILNHLTKWFMHIRMNENRGEDKNRVIFHDAIPEIVNSARWTMWFVLSQVSSNRKINEKQCKSMTY